MRRYLTDVLEVIMITVMIVVVIVMLVVLPMLYLCGRANADVLRNQHGIDMPWYRAAFITVRVDTVKADIDRKE